MAEVMTNRVLPTLIIAIHGGDLATDIIINF